MKVSARPGEALVIMSMTFCGYLGNWFILVQSWGKYDNIGIHKRQHGDLHYICILLYYFKCSQYQYYFKYFFTFKSYFQVGALRFSQDDEDLVPNIQVAAFADVAAMLRYLQQAMAVKNRDWLLGGPTTVT